MNRYPLDHIPPAIAETVLRVLAPHYLPIWSGNSRVRTIPAQGAWTGELASMTCVDTLEELTEILEHHKESRISIYYRNNDCTPVCEVDSLLRDMDARCLVYIQE